MTGYITGSVTLRGLGAATAASPLPKVFSDVDGLETFAGEFTIHYRQSDGTLIETAMRLAYALNQVLEARTLSQADAAKVRGVTQPKVSALRHYKLAGFSVERLMNLLTAVDQDVEIVIRRKPRSRKAGRISVVAA